MGIENPELLSSDDSGPTKNVSVNDLSETSDDAELNELQDIEDLLNRETGDGKGDEEVPEADFVSFATGDAEKENDK